jgi:hypothetical protein
LDKPDQFRTVCGDFFVSQMHYGAYLYVVYQLHFLKQVDRQKFDDTFSASYSDFGKFTASMQDEVDKLHLQGNIHIFAFQTGGNPQYLSDIFKSPKPIEPSPISQCSFDDLKACDEVTTSIMNYVTTTDPDSFPNQLKLNPGDEVPQSAAVIGLEPLDYSHIVPITTTSKLMPEIVAARDALGAALTQAQNDLQTNEAIIRDAGEVCFNNLDNCIAAKQQADATVLPIDRSTLTVPESVAVTIADSQSTTQLLVATTSIPDPQNLLGVDTSPTSGSNQTQTAVCIDGPNIIIIERDPVSGTIVATFNGGLIGINQYSGTMRFSSTGAVYNWTGTLSPYENPSVHSTK